MPGKIFYRERKLDVKGEKKPRYRVVGVFDIKLKIYANHMRLSELRHLAEETGAELVLLRRGFETDKPEKDTK